ncbi:uncharacterized protein LOC143365992 [Andrena cerasifolii]|uniref:uncharacterized protein LOC143365992 n=1 Tax=Andrena cerasifolii TaxID=2819439 RepID=UPI004037DA06
MIVVRQSGEEEKEVGGVCPDCRARSRFDGRSDEGPGEHNGQGEKKPCFQGPFLIANEKSKKQELLLELMRRGLSGWLLMLHPCKMFVEDEEEEPAAGVMTNERMTSSSNFTCR